MKKFMNLTLMLLVLVISVNTLSYPSSASNLGNYQAGKGEQKVNVWVVINVRDYKTDLPIQNVTLSMSITTAWKEGSVGPISTNETGTAKVYFGEYMPRKGEQPSLEDLILFNNYTLIKINNLFIEDIDFTGEYSVNSTRYDNLGTTLLQRNTGREVLIIANLWLLKGKLIRISDFNPFTGKKQILIVKPAVKAAVNISAEENGSDYESYYFFPIGYSLTISNKPERGGEFQNSISVTVNESTTSINWAYYYAREYYKKELKDMNREFLFFDSAGLPMSRERKELTAINNLFQRIIDLYQRSEYSSAFGGARLFIKRINNLKDWLSNIKAYSLLTTISVLLFAYGLAALLPALILEEKINSIMRLILKIMIFTLLIIIFSLTHPSLKVAYALLVRAATQSASFRMDIPSILIGCFTFSSLTYFIMAVISSKKNPLTDLALRLGIRGLKRRPARSILTLITIIIIVSAAIIFVDISANRESRVKSAWRGTDRRGIVISTSLSDMPINMYDVNWIKTQKWSVDIGYLERIYSYEYVAETLLQRFGILGFKGETSTIEIVGVDPAYMDRAYNLSDYIKGSWSKFKVGEPVAVIPSSLNIAMGDYIKLAVEEYTISSEGISFRGRRWFGSFHVIGRFDPTALSQIKMIDGKPLFSDPSKTVLVPIGSIKDPAVIIYDVEVKLPRNIDPVKVAEETSYMLGMPVVANKDGVAMEVEWSLEMSIRGFIPYLFPLIISGLMVYITTSSIYEERRKEFMTMATLGLDPKNTFQVFIAEVILLGLTATFISFVGSYLLMLTLFYIAEPLGLTQISSSSYIPAHWSAYSILVAIFTGVLMPLLGGYIPATRAQGLSLMGRIKRRSFIGELITTGDTVRFPLPIRETVQNSEMLYRYIRETLGKFKRSLIDPNSIKGEIRRDGSFTVSFPVLGLEKSTTIPCKIEGEREGERLTPILEFPAAFKEYGKIREIIRDLEEHIIHFSAWKEIQLKMKIVREAPKRKKTLEEVLSEVKETIQQIRDCNRKLKILDSQKEQLSEEVYNEFKEKYKKKAENLLKGLRSMAISLEPYHDQMLEEMKRIDVEIERITTAYNLGEITEEEYIRRCGPLRGRIDDLKAKIRELEEIINFLKMPSNIT